MAAWLTSKDKDESDDPEDDLDDLHEPEMAWELFKFMDNTQGDDWQWLPHLFPGGLLSMPAWAMHDLMVLKRAKEITTDMLKPARPEQRGEE